MTANSPRNEPEGLEGLAADSTNLLLAQAREGDQRAVDALYTRYWPILRRWAHGRLPAHARDLQETDDLVQNSLIRALKRLNEFEPRKQGAFLAYLRQILKNQIRDQIRRVGRRGVAVEVPESLTDGGVAPDRKVIERELFEQYDAALEDDLERAARVAAGERVPGRDSTSTRLRGMGGLAAPDSPSTNQTRISEILRKLPQEYWVREYELVNPDS